METLDTLELIPTKEELTRLVGSFAETVECLMDIRGTRTETPEDVRRRHRDDEMDTMYGYRPAVFKFYRKIVLKDGTEIRLVFNPPDKSLGNVGVVVKIGITHLPADRFIKINGLKNARFHTFTIANYSIGSNSPEPILPGFLLGANDCKGGKFDVDSSKDIPEKNSICGEILHELHKLIIEAMYQPYQKPARNWFQKVFS